MSAKTILITGVSRGLGRAMTEEFIRLGHVVLGCGRSSKEIAALQKQFPTPNDFAVVDVADDTQVAAWAKRVLATHAAPDLLLNNAALINRNAPLWQVPAAEFSDVIDVNIKGVANVIRHFVPAMIARRSGVIVNFSSGWGRSTDADVAPYCATKWAIEGLTQALAQELPPGLAAVPLNPGIINTAMLQSCFTGGADNFPKAEEWAKTAVPFLLKLNAGDNGKQLTVSIQRSQPNNAKVQFWMNYQSEEFRHASSRHSHAQVSLNNAIVVVNADAFIKFAGVICKKNGRNSSQSVRRLDSKLMSPSSAHLKTIFPRVPSKRRKVINFERSRLMKNFHKPAKVGLSPIIGELLGGCRVTKF